MQDTKTYSNSFTDYFKLLPPGFLEALESNQQGGTPAKDSKGGLDLTSPFFGHASPGTPGATSPATASSSLRVSFVPAGSPAMPPGTPGPGGALPSAFALPQEPVTPPKPLPALRPILPVASDDALDMIESAREPRREALIQTEVDASLRRYAGTSGVEARADALRQLLQQAGGFDTRLRYAMDYDLWLRLSLDAKPLQMNEAFTAFREHAGSLSTRNRIAAMQEDLQVRLQHTGPRPMQRLLHHLRFQVRKRRALRQLHYGILKHA